MKHTVLLSLNRRRRKLFLNLIIMVRKLELVGGLRVEIPPEKSGFK